MKQLLPDNESQRNAIEALNTGVYAYISNGAYEAGSSSDQAVYAKVFNDYFIVLNKLASPLSSDQRLYLTGDTFTEADLRLLPTLYRHGPVYYIYMELNAAKILH